MRIFVIIIIKDIKMLKEHNFTFNLFITIMLIAITKNFIIEQVIDVKVEIYLFLFINFKQVKHQCLKII